MRVVVAPDKFKGTLSASQAAEAIARGLRAGGADTDICPIADGGEGTLEALITALDGTAMGVIARGPMGVPVRAHLGRLQDGTGIVELAQASGLRLVPEGERDPMRASTFGTGELIKGALARRPPKLIVAIGGSATVDGGTGLARALGARFLDASGGVVPEGEPLERIAKIDLSGLDPRLAGVPIVVASDVFSPLVGENGAARVFGPQKGATPGVVDLLDRGLQRLGEVIERDLHVSVLETPGAGAAGGVGAMLMALGATFRSGAEVVLEAVHLEERIRRAQLVVTGEGLLDESSLAGKAPVAVAELANEMGVPCVAVAGEATITGPPFADVRTLVEHFKGDRTQAMERAAAGLQAIGARLASDRRRA